MKKKIGVIGTGIVGKVLAAGSLKHGHEVMIGSRDAAKGAALAAEIGAGARAGSFAEAASFGDVVLLAVRGGNAEAALRLAGPGLDGKVVIDATNPIVDDAPPVNGVLPFFTGPNDSLMERLQKAFPAARLVKAFNSVGNAFMVDPAFPGGRPTMFICGGDEAAKADVAAILDEFGWEVADMGAVEAARAIEPLCQLWCIPGLSKGRWTHAFKLLQL